MATLRRGLDWLTRGWLWLTLLLSPIIALAGGLGYQAFVFLLGAAAILLALADRRSARYLKDIWPIALVLWLLWTWAAMAWSPYEAAVFGGNASILFGMVLVLPFLFLVTKRLSARAATVTAWLVIFGTVIGALLILIDAAGDHVLSLWADPVQPGEDAERRRGDAEMNLGRGQVSLLVLAWPAIALMFARLKKGWIVAALFGLALITSALFNSLSVAIFAFLAPAAFAVLAYRNPMLGLKLAFALARISVLFAPLVGVVASLVSPELLERLPLSWEHRLRMWSYSWELICQFPLIGHGFDSSRVFDTFTFTAPDGREIPVISMHPHNIGLQIWLETGVIGAILATVFVGSLMRPVTARCASPLRAMAAAGLISATALSSAVTIGVWQHWWWALIALSASLIGILPLRD